MRKNTKIDGIAACQAIDSSGEILDIEKLDISSLGAEDSVFNYEHKSKDNPSQVVGKVTFAKKIMKKSDCSNDRQRYWWNKVKVPFIYAKGELFDAEGHRGAEEVAAIFRYKNKNKGKKARSLMGWSIEGGTMDRDGIMLGHSLARDIAITVKPCNKTCHAEIIEDEDFQLYKSETIYTDTKVEELIKEEYPEMKSPSMNKEQAQEKYGKVTIKDTQPKTFGKIINVGDKQASQKTPQNSKMQVQESKPNSAKIQPKTGFADQMSQKHTEIIPKGHVDRKKMVNHIAETHRSGKVNEARRLFDRFISGGGNFTSAVAGIKKSEKLEKGYREDVIDSTMFHSKGLKTHKYKNKQHVWENKHGHRSDKNYGKTFSSHEDAILHHNELYPGSKVRLPKSKNDKLEKTLTAGSGMGGVPSSMTQGAALAKEDMGKIRMESCTYEGKDIKLQDLSKEGGKKRKKRCWNGKADCEPVSKKERMEDLFKSWNKKNEFINFLQKRLPNLSKKEITSIAKVYCYKIHKEAEKNLI